MKVLLVISGLSMGGAEKVVADLADALVSSGWGVRLVYLKGPLQVRPRRPEVGLLCLNMRSVADLVQGCLRFRKTVREFKPDIVHSHMFHATMLARLMRLCGSIPRMISTMHTAYDGHRLRAAAYRLTDRLTDISTNVSYEAVDAFVASGAVPPGRMIAIHNGIAVDKFQALPSARADIRASFGLDRDCKLFVAVGRLGRSKDYPNMFHALARLRGDLHFRLVIAGDGPLRPQLQQVVGRLGLSSHVRFLGIRSDIVGLMSAADVFVLSSAGEGFGLVVAEAMACECVVVATDSGGVREVLGEAGFLVPSRDPVALANALLAASSLGHEDAVELRRAARRRIVEMYSFDRSMEKWRELYGRLMAVHCAASEHAAS